MYTISSLSPERIFAMMVREKKKKTFLHCSVTGSNVRYVTKGRRHVVPIQWAITRENAIADNFFFFFAITAF